MCEEHILSSPRSWGIKRQNSHLPAAYFTPAQNSGACRSLEVSAEPTRGVLALDSRPFVGEGFRRLGLTTLLIPPDGGLQELSGHFENQRVMYGFCSVKDSQAALPKYVLINWVCTGGLGRGAEGPRTVLLHPTPLTDAAGRELQASACP